MALPSSSSFPGGVQVRILSLSRCYSTSLLSNFSGSLSFCPKYFLLFFFPDQDSFVPPGRQEYSITPAPACCAGRFFVCFLPQIWMIRFLGAPFPLVFTPSFRLSFSFLWHLYYILSRPLPPKLESPAFPFSVFTVLAGTSRPFQTEPLCLLLFCQRCLFFAFPFFSH